jgi:hypothetical protein
MFTEVMWQKQPSNKSNAASCSVPGHAQARKHIIMLRVRLKRAVTVWDSNQVRRFPCFPEVDSLPQKIDCTPAKVTALMRDSYYQR